LFYSNWPRKIWRKTWNKSNSLWMNCCLCNKDES
jgi:hypothetical protein